MLQTSVSSQTLVSSRCIQTFAVVDPSVRVEWASKDGDRVVSGQSFGTLEGNALSILTGERVALNFLQRMSGIATATAAMVSAVQVRALSEQN